MRLTNIFNLKRIYCSFIGMFILLNMNRAQSFSCYQYSAGSPLPAGAYVNACIAADLNNDGNQDLISANYMGHGVGIFTGTGGGNFMPMYDYLLDTLSYPVSVASGDINGDGYIDIVAASLVDSRIIVIRNMGGGVFAPPAICPLPSFPSDVELCDMNNDGNLDIVSGSGGDIAILTGLGNGFFDGALPFSAGASMVTSITAGDFNEDGNLDVVAAIDGGVSVKLGNGMGGLGATVHYPIGGSCSSVSVEVADLNNDLHLDMVVSKWYCHHFYIFNGDGSGSFSAPDSVYSTNVYGINIADMNNDGFDDILTANLDNNFAQIFTNDTVGGFDSLLTITTGDGPQWITTADLNNSSLPDIAIANTYSDNLTILLDQDLVVDIISTADTICIGQSAILTATGADNYLWNTTQTSSFINVSPIITTTYSVSATINSLVTCFDTAFIEITVIPCLGTEDEEGFILTAYPNPAFETVRINGSVVINQLCIIDLNGKVVKQIQPVSENTEIDLSGLAMGLYVLRAYTKDRVDQVKILKQN